MTIHVVTVHHNNDKWIDLQLRFLRRELPGALVWASLEGISEIHHAKFDRVIPCLGQHAGKLNLLAREVCATASNDDLICFLDGDAMPVRPLRPRIEKWLQDHEFAAVQRLENSGDIQPHPCFAVTRVSTWRDIAGDWSAGYPWRNKEGTYVTDVGGNLLCELERHQKPWLPLTRTNRVDLHPLYFGIYADVIYHHGSGFRNGTGRIIKNRAKKWTRRIPNRRLRKLVQTKLRQRVSSKAQSMADQLFEAATVDDDFFRVLEGRK